MRFVFLTPLFFFALPAGAMPDNAYAVGERWFCEAGYKRQGNICNKLNAPKNADVFGSNWFCHAGYKKLGNTCSKIKAPLNATIFESGWTCNTGYRQQGSQCHKMKAPKNAQIEGNFWICKVGYRREGNTCVNDNLGRQGTRQSLVIINAPLAPNPLLPIIPKSEALLLNANPLIKPALSAQILSIPSFVKPQEVEPELVLEKRLRPLKYKRFHSSTVQ
ncbi:MAG: hypothetical protein ACPG47_08780 [Leucothrix sp.]